jgi:4-nitrophenol 2-monooxygenase / 4-nitrocatechol 4-monooxygenase, reductase component
MLLVCMNRLSSTAQAIAVSRRFAVNILSEEQAAAAERFARKSDDKFVAVSFSGAPGGPPLLDGSLATFACRVVHEVDGGAHTVFLAEVDRAQAREGSPLAYFRGRMGRMGRLGDELAGRTARQPNCKPSPAWHEDE